MGEYKPGEEVNQLSVNLTKEEGMLLEDGYIRRRLIDWAEEVDLQDVASLDFGWMGMETKDIDVVLVDCGIAYHDEDWSNNDGVLENVLEGQTFLTKLGCRLVASMVAEYRNLTSEDLATANLA